MSDPRFGEPCTCFSGSSTIDTCAEINGMVYIGVDSSLCPFPTEEVDNPPLLCSDAEGFVDPCSGDSPSVATC